MTMSKFDRYWWLYLLRGLLALGFGVSVMVTAILFPGITVQALVILFGAYLVMTGTVATTSAIIYRPESLWGSLLMNGLLSITLGVLAFVWTDLTAVALVLGFALWMIVTGVLDVVSAIRLRRVAERQWNLAFSGVIALVVGTLIIAYPAVGVLGVMWLIGGFAAVSGLLSMSYGWRRRAFRERPASEREVPPNAESKTA